MFVNSLLAATFAGLAAAQVDLDFGFESKFKAKHAAFINMGKYEDSEDFMLVSSFGAFSSGHVYMVEGVKDAVVAGSAHDLETVKLDTPDFKWPNNVETIPFDVFGERAILVPDGFLVPGKGDGGMYIIRMDPEDLT